MSNDPAPRHRPVRYLELLARAAAYIDAHLGTDLSADQLASQAAMSRYHFQRIFRVYFGTTLNGYVTLRRLQRACDLLAQGHTSVLQIALEVGYDSAQALAKAMRRELDTTPTAIRAGALPNWQRLFDRRPLAAPSGAAPTPTIGEQPMLTPKMIDIPALPVLTATAYGMEGGTMTRAAKQGFEELWAAIGQAGLQSRAWTCLAIFPDEPQGQDDPQCRLLAGAVFDYALFSQEGQASRPDLPLSGSLAWTSVPAGHHAVFTHIGPYDDLHELWTGIYRHWLPATGYALRDTPPFEIYVNNPETTAPENLRTDIYLPLA
jgi:AraC family transcriptional regulator